RKEDSARGALLFTHFGFSGPAALDISRHFALASAEDKPEILADFLPENEELKLPKRFYETMKKKFGPDADKKIRRYPLPVTGVYGYKKAEVTAGGVALSEVNVATKESKKVKGLYFA